MAEYGDKNGGGTVEFASMRCADGTLLQDKLVEFASACAANGLHVVGGIIGKPLGDSVKLFGNLEQEAFEPAFELLLNVTRGCPKKELDLMVDFKPERVN